MIAHEIIGDDMQAVVLTLGAGGEIRAEAGATMTGPGRVGVQTLPFSRLADRIFAAHRGDREEVKRDFGGTLRAIGDIIGGDR